MKCTDSEVIFLVRFDYSFRYVEWLLRSFNLHYMLEIFSVDNQWSVLVRTKYSNLVFNTLDAFWFHFISNPRILAHRVMQQLKSSFLWGCNNVRKGKHFTLKSHNFTQWICIITLDWYRVVLKVCSELSVFSRFFVFYTYSNNNKLIVEVIFCKAIRIKCDSSISLLVLFKGDYWNEPSVRDAWLLICESESCLLS